MKVSDLIGVLEKLKKEHGDVDVLVQTLSHTWPPEPVVRLYGKDSKYVLLNP